MKPQKLKKEKIIETTNGEYVGKAYAGDQIVMHGNSVFIVNPSRPVRIICKAEDGTRFLFPLASGIFN